MMSREEEDTSPVSYYGKLRSLKLSKYLLFQIEDDPNVIMYVSPDDPTTSVRASSSGFEQRSDRIVGRQIQKGKVFYEIQPAVHFGFSSTIYEEPSKIAPYNIAKFEYEYHGLRESAYPIPDTDPNAQPVSIRWFGVLNEQRYFLIEYENQVQRLVEMNDSPNVLDPARKFISENVELYLKNCKIDMHGDEWPSDPVNFDFYSNSVPGPSNPQKLSISREKACSCSLSRLVQKAKPRLCLSKLESIIRRKKASTPSRKKGFQSNSSDSDGEEPPKKFGRQT